MIHTEHLDEIEHWTIEALGNDQIRLGLHFDGCSVRMTLTAQQWTKMKAEGDRLLRLSSKLTRSSNG